MHRALTIIDIVQLVLLQICPDPTKNPSKEETTDLATLARTCKTLGDPALDALWSFQNTYVNVLKCMPPDVWSPAFKLRRPIRGSDWDRVLPYLYRVRNFSASDFTLPAHVDHAAVFEILRLALPFTHLFPHLHRLQWIAFPRASLALASLLLPPTLTAIVLGTFETTSQFSMLHSLAVKCPLLARVDIELSPLTGIGFSEAVASFISAVHRVEWLEASYLDRTAFAHLIALPHLPTLHLQSPDFEKPLVSRAPKPSDPAAPTFIALRDVTLRDASAQSVQIFIAAVSLSPLRNLDLLTMEPAPDASSVTEIFRALRPCLFRTTLTRITLFSERFRPVKGRQPNPPPVTIKGVSMLFHFTNLTVVQLIPASGIDLSDDDILSLAQAWPHLRTLFLPTRLPYTPAKALTLRSLLNLAEHCHELKALQMVVDASTIPPVEPNRNKPRVMQCALEYWQVGASAISLPLQVARFLSAMFPALTSVNTDRGAYIYAEPDEEDDDDDLVELWQKLNAALPICRGMREEGFLGTTA
ncbi:hypothetical protein C8R46DRAFT_1082069 [Mycena filopes]|nr:hypothetical protein C8R46DRAFT_1082069 [Mycena filopes]